MRISDWSSDVCSSDLFQFRPSSHLLREFIAEKFHAIAAVFLGLIHSHIRRPQQRMQRFAMLGIESHADRRAQVDLLATYIEPFAQCILHGPRNALRSLDRKSTRLNSRH